MSLPSRLFATLFFSVVMCLTAYGQVPPTRILPLGDSITDGGGSGSYRKKLYQLLTAAGYNVDFIGNQLDNPAALPDSNHEGHSGWTIRQIDANITGWLNAITDPDVILVHIGTNDFGTNDDTTNAIHRLDALVTKMATLRPFAHIVVTNLMVRNEPQNSQIQSQFNPYVQDLVAAQAALGRRVTFLDMRSAVPLSEMPDQLHPNQAGNDHMAGAWFPAIQAVTGPQGDSIAPVILRALGDDDLTHVTITFSKPLAESAANPTHYTLSGGLTVTSANLDATKRKVTLVTSPQTRGVAYTATLNGVVDRTPAALPLPAGSVVNFFGATARGYLNNVPESSEYTLAYSLDIPNTANYGAVNYAVDNHKSIGAFSRVAYYLELQTPDGGLQYVWSSMDAFTTDAGKIAVPTVASGAVFQQAVSGMNVISNSPGILNGTNLAGNLEFWPTNYDLQNSANVPGASNSTFDFGDIRSNDGSYGSMQLHNPSASQTIFAFNHWGNSGGTIPVDLGIGNNPGAHPDWTIANNGSSYVVKTLQVLVRANPDTVAPSLSSATATHGRTQVLVRFSEPLAAASVKPECFSLDNGVAILGATLASNRKDVYLLTTKQPAGVPLTLVVNAVRDSSSSANRIAQNATTAVALPALPAAVVSNVGAPSAGYELVASIDIPLVGNFNASDDAFSLDDRVAQGAFSKVAYFLELKKPNEATKYVWTSMDAFTANRAKLCLPTAATGAVFQQNVANLSVISNVPGVVNGTTVSGGNIEMWPNDYTRTNGAAVPNATGADFDTGDARDNVDRPGYGCFQVHNHDSGANQTLLAINHFGTDGYILEMGIGNNPVIPRDWTYTPNAGEYERKVLHVMVLPGSKLPPNVESNIPSAAGYQLAYSLNIPAAGNVNNLVYSVNNGADLGPFKRIAYYMELRVGSGTPSYVWASMDAFTSNGRHIGVPTQASGAFFQQKVTNLEVVSNVAGISNGSFATDGNIEFWSGNYTGSNGIGIPNASSSAFDFGDGNAETNAGYGSMQVHNHAASQTLFAFNRFGVTNGTNPYCLGIGNNPSGEPDWTFADNAGSYSSRVLHVFVLPGSPDSVAPTVASATPSPTLDRLVITFDEMLSDSSAAVANFSIPGLTVTGATLLPSMKEIALTTTIQNPGTTYTVNISGVRDRSPSANLITPGTSKTFQAYVAPVVLANVAESSGYQLVYKLPIPTARSSWNRTAIPYTIDETRYGEKLFDRVAYLLELDGKWAYASFDKHVSLLAKTGVPNFSVSALPIQQNVTNLNVFSNVPGVVNGTGLTSGNIEFWAGNYAVGNVLGIPNASGTTLDFGDTMGPGGDYGCMQVHNHAASQTVFAFNNWGESVNPTINVGIGNNPNAGSAGENGGNQMPDWTFAPTAPSYTVRNLYVLVRPGGTAVGAAPLLLSQSASRVVDPGESTTLSVSATGGVGPLSYQWRFEGTPIPAATRPWLDLVSVGQAQTGYYDVVVTGANLVAATSKVMLVTLSQSLAVGNYHFTARRNTPASISNALILAKASGGQNIGISSVTNPSVQGGAVALAGAGITYTPATSFLGEDSFTVTVVDTLGVTASGTVNMTVTAAGAIVGGQSILAMRVDGKVDLLFSAVPTHTYEVQRSINLLAEGWQPLANIPAGDDGLLPFTDAEPPVGKAFYRLFSQPD